MGKHRRNLTPRRWQVRVVVPAAAALLVSGVALAVDWDEPAPSGGGGDSVTAGADPNVNALSLGAEWWPYSPAPGQLGAVPQAFGFDHLLDGRRTTKTFVTVARGPDASGAVPNGWTGVAEDNSKLFDRSREVDGAFTPAASRKLRDGRVMIAHFTPAAAPGSASRVGITIETSADNGATWSKSVGPIVQDKWPISWYRVTGRQIIEQNDGTLLLGFYGPGKVNGVDSWLTGLLQSTDGGKSWTQRSILNSSSGSTAITPGSSELALAETSDGRLLAITRSLDPAGTLPLPMGQQFSADGGKTWTARAPYVPPKGLTDRGIMPELQLQPNGAMVLSYGRPDNYVAVSWDGTGNTWNDGKLVFSNYIRKGNIGRWMGSSGNTALVKAESNYSINFGDRCHNLWSCQEYGQQTGIWARRIDAVTAGVGKLDLTTGVREGTVKLTGNVVTGTGGSSEQRLAGAVDGSSDYLSAARLATTGPKRVTVELDREYPINRIGLMLERGMSNGAKVQLSTDGQKWSDPVVRQRNSTDFALRYHDIVPTWAKFVRISNDGSAPFTALTELELYAADLYTFENDAANVTPRGLVDTLHAFTAERVRWAQPNAADMAGFRSERRMIVVDTDAATHGRATFPREPSAGAHLSFQFAGEGYGEGPVWELLGTNAAGDDVVAYKFHLAPDWNNNRMNLHAWDGAAWRPAGSFPGLTPNWNFFPVEINATAEKATLTVTGSTLSTSVRAGDATQLGAFRVSTGRTAASVSMEHSYDDVEFTALGAVAPQISSPTVTPSTLQPGQSATVTAVLTNRGLAPASAITAELQVPAGWSAQQTAPPTVLEPGQQSTLSWTVRPAANAEPGVHDLRATVSYTADGRVLSGTSPAATVELGRISKERTTATATSQQPGGEAGRAVDGNPATFWHTAYHPQQDVPPQSLTVTLDVPHRVSQLTYLPRQDSSSNGVVTAYRVSTSVDGKTFTTVATGSLPNDKTLKRIPLTGVKARLVRFEATAGVGNYVTAAEVALFGVTA